MNENEKLYLASMAFARSMLLKGLLTEEEYRKIDTIFTKKYRPSLGALLSDIDLIKTNLYGNMSC